MTVTADVDVDETVDVGITVCVGTGVNVTVIVDVDPTVTVTVYRVGVTTCIYLCVYAVVSSPSSRDVTSASDCPSASAPSLSQ